MSSGKSGGYISSDLDIEKLIKKGMDLNTQSAEEQNNNQENKPENQQEKTEQDKIVVDDKIKENPNLQQLFGIKPDDTKKDNKLEDIKQETENTQKNTSEITLYEKQEQSVQQLQSDDKNIQSQDLNKDISKEEKNQDLNKAKEQNLSISSETDKLNQNSIDNTKNMDKNTKDSQNIENTIEDIEKKAEPVKSLSQLIEKGQNILNLSPEERKPYKYQQNSQTQDSTSKAQTEIKTDTQQESAIDKPIFTKIEDEPSTIETFKKEKDDLNRVETKTAQAQDDIKAVDKQISFEVENKMDLNNKTAGINQKPANEPQEKQSSQIPQVKTDMEMGEPKVVNIEKKSNEIRKKRVAKPDTKAINDLLSQNNLKTMKAVSANNYISYSKSHNKNIQNKDQNKTEVKKAENIQNSEKLEKSQKTSNSQSVETVEKQSTQNINKEKTSRENMDLAGENNININLAKSENQIQNTDILKENDRLEKLEKAQKIEEVQKLDNTQEIEKTKKIENVQKFENLQKVEDTQKIEKIPKIESFENIEKASKPETTENIERLDNYIKAQSNQNIERLDNIDNLSGKKVDIQKVEKGVNQELNRISNKQNSNLEDTQRFSGRFPNLEQTQKVPLIKSIREKNQKINSDYGSNSYNSTNYNSFRNDNYNTSGVKSTIPSYPPKNNGRKIEQKAMYAGFWIRVLAFLIDYLLVAGITNIVSYFNPFEINPILESFLFVIILVIYNFISVYSTNGYTIGKLFTNIKVVSEKSDNISFLTALTREVIGKFIIVKTFILPFFLVFSDKKHHLIDYLSDTSVIRQKYQDMYEDLKAKGQL